MYGSRRTGTDREATLRGMLQLIRHRGPNEAGMYLCDRLCMGTVRLSILGIQSGQQPMHDEAEGFFLCYNGELYNYIELREELRSLGHEFSTGSDTEVVLHAWREWGPRCLARFNGGFAFALYDRHEDALYLVRDRYGKRPLFHANHAGTLLFGSEMKCFLAVEGFSFQFDAQQLASILTLWTPVGEQTGYRQIRQVPQGAYLKVSGAQHSLTRYDQMDFRPPVSIGSEAEALDAIRSTLGRAVDIRLRSDVEVGMYLSGGLDSSILASLLAGQVRGRFRTYSVSFAEGEFDESADQLRMAAHVGSTHRVLHVTDEMIVQNFPAAAWHAEVPVFRTAPVPMFLLSRMVRDDGIKVVITGEGADEAFLGYDLFKETLLRRDWAHIDDAEKVRRLQLLYPYLRHYQGANSLQMLGLYQQFSTERHAGLFSHELRIQNGFFSRRLLRSRPDALAAIHAVIAEHPGFDELSPVEKAQWLEYQSLLPGYLLSSQGDRMALAHSVENRCPFLDPRVVELSSAVNLKFDDGSDEKHLLRKAFADRLPPENLRKRKHPYRAPDSQAFARKRPDYLELLLSQNELRKIEVLDPTFCGLLANKVLDGSAEAVGTKENQAFVFMLSLCLDHYYFVRREVSAVAVHPDLEDIMVRIVDRRHASEHGTDRAQMNTSLRA
jgi:asparagine synthase (glutamine-hydrolysing)